MNYGQLIVLVADVSFQSHHLQKNDVSRYKLLLERLDDNATTTKTEPTRERAAPRRAAPVFSTDATRAILGSVKAFEFLALRLLGVPLGSNGN